MKSLERLISCMVTELSDHAAIDAATFLEAVISFDRRAEWIINRKSGTPAFWDYLDKYSDARKSLLEEREEWEAAK